VPCGAPVESLAPSTRIVVEEDLPAWPPAHRSRPVLRSSPRRSFVDPSLAAAAIDAGSGRLPALPRTLGLLVETLVARDIGIDAQAIGAEVFHHHEAGGLEIDAVLQRRDGAWAAIELELGQGTTTRLRLRCRAWRPMSTPGATVDPHPSRS
jgi:hypothetical protein